MPRSPSWRACVCALMAVLACSSRAQPTAALEGSVTEDFHGMRPQSAIGLVVGLVQGPPTATIDPRQLRALLPPSARPRHVCFNATTFDSVYSASAALRAGPGAAGALAIGDRNFSRHAANLQAYAAEEIAVSFALDDRCDAPTTRATLVPATFGGPLNLIRVAINTRPPRTMSVALTFDGGTTQTYLGTCRSLGPRARAFLHVCDLQVDRAGGGKATLRVTRKLGAAPARTDSFDVVIASTR